MKKDAMEERILAGSGNLFFSNGVRSMTMDDIASSLGISKKTIYLYFRDKSDLVKSFTCEILKGHETDIRQIRKNSVDSVDEMLHIMVHVENFFTRVNPTVFYDLKKYHPESWNLFIGFKEKFLVNFVEENLRKGIQHDLYRKELKTKILARLRIEEVELGVNRDIFPPGQYSVTEVQLSLLDHFLYGIVTLKGFQLIEKYRKNYKKVKTEMSKT